jgi:Fe-S cluster biogenesis protein NfuA
VQAIEVQVKTTENPAVISFEVDRQISNREVKYETLSEAEVSPIAKKLFGFPWTQSVTVGSNFVSLQKKEWVEWDTIADPAAGLIKAHLEYTASNSENNLEENPETQNAEKTYGDDEVSQIQKLIDERINPALGSHGGGCELVEVKDHTAYVRLSGGCQGCAMAQATLRNGIERIIKQHVPTIEAVQDATDHGTGNNPYY